MEYELFPHITLVCFPLEISSFPPSSLILSSSAFVSYTLKKYKAEQQQKNLDATHEKTCKICLSECDLHCTRVSCRWYNFVLFYG